MKCKDCKNYELKDKLPEVRVKVWYYGAVPLQEHGHEVIANDMCNVTYTFCGQPDWERLVAETLGRGAEVVRVVSSSGYLKCFYSDKLEMKIRIISKYKLNDSFNTGKEIMNGYFWTHEPMSDSNIEAAIREHHKVDEPKPNWKEAARKAYYEKWLPECKGERHTDACAMCIEHDKFDRKYVCPLSRKGQQCSHAIYNCIPYVDWAVAETDEKNHLAAIAIASRLAEIAGITTGEHLDKPVSEHKRGELCDAGAVFEEYKMPPNQHRAWAGELRVPRKGEWYYLGGFANHADSNNETGGKPREILMLVPDEPRFKVGDWVYAINFSTLGTIDQIHDETLYVKEGNGTVITFAYDECRPAVSADFERVVDGVKVRLYERTDGKALLLTSKTDCRAIFKTIDTYPYNTVEGILFKALSNVPCDDGSIGIPVIPLSVSGGKFEAPE